MAPWAHSHEMDGLAGTNLLAPGDRGLHLLGGFLASHPLEDLARTGRTAAPVGAHGASLPSDPCAQALRRLVGKLCATMVQVQEPAPDAHATGDPAALAWPPLIDLIEQVLLGDPARALDALARAAPPTDSCRQ